MIYKYQPEGSEDTFEVMIQEIFKRFFKANGYVIDPTKVTLYGDSNITTEEVQALNNSFFDLYFLLKKLKEENYIHFISSSINIKSSYNKSGTVVSTLNLPNEDIGLLLELISSRFYASGKLHDLVKNKYRNSEQQALFETRRALYFSIGISLISILSSWWIAENVSTVIKFDENVKLERTAIIEIQGIDKSKLILLEENQTVISP